MNWFTHWNNRKLEWSLALYTLLYGVILLLPFPSMNSESFRSALLLLPEGGWGVLYATVGVMHNIALHVNGRGWWTPFARITALIMNSQVFLAMSISLAEANLWGTGTFTYGFIAIGFCGPAVWTAAHDCGREIAIWRNTNERN